MKKKLCIISLPLTRNVRYILTTPFFKCLQQQQNLDILIVSSFPFTEDSKKFFGGQNVYFIKINSDEKFQNIYIKTLYSLSEKLRTTGFFRHKRKMISDFYIKLEELQWQNEGEKAERRPLHKRVLARALGFIGSNANAWLMIDNLFGHFFYRCISPVKDFVKNYPHAVLMQMANFTLQERALAHWSRQTKTPSVFLPYSLDQLAVNGYMINTHSAIFTQGHLEKSHAIRLMDQPPNKICEAGSTWLKQLRPRLSASHRKRCSKTLLYCGNNIRYYPLAAELKTIDFLTKHLRSGRYKIDRIIYRPMPANEVDKKRIVDSCVNYPEIELKFPSSTFFGLKHEFCIKTYEQSLTAQLEQISEIDLLIMPCFSSVALDFSINNIPIILSYIDHNELLKTTLSNGSEKVYASQASPMQGSNVTQVFSFEALDTALLNALTDDQPKPQGCSLADLWDLPIDTDKVIFNKICQILAD